MKPFSKRQKYESYPKLTAMVLDSIAIWICSYFLYIFTSPFFKIIIDFKHQSEVFLCFLGFWWDSLQLIQFSRISDDFLTDLYAFTSIIQYKPVLVIIKFCFSILQRLTCHGHPPGRPRRSWGSWTPSRYQRLQL